MLPDHEAAFIAALSGVAETRTQMPQQMPGEFIRVSRVAGSLVNVLQTRPTVLVECWSATSRLAASDLAAQAWQALLAAQHTVQAGVIFGWVDLSLPVELPDPDRPTHWRLQFTATTTTAQTQT